MKDLRDRLEKLRTDAEDCLLISKLATSPVKRQTFLTLSEQYKALADSLERTIASGEVPEQP